MSQNKEVIPHADLIRAVLDGKEVEYLSNDNLGWRRFSESANALLYMANCPHWQYRIKPEPVTKEQALEALRNIVAEGVWANDDEENLRRFIEESP